MLHCAVLSMYVREWGWLRAQLCNCRCSKRTHLPFSIRLIPEILRCVIHHPSHRSSIVSLEGKHLDTISHLHLLDNKNMFIHRSGYEWVCGIKELPIFVCFFSQNPPPPPWLSEHILVLIPSVSSPMLPNMVSLWNIIWFSYISGPKIVSKRKHKEQDEKKRTTTRSC